MPAIRVKENEPFEVAIRRFKRTVEKTGLLTELRAREFYEKPTAERKRKLAAAVKRHHKRMRSQMLPPKLYYAWSADHATAACLETGGFSHLCVCVVIGRPACVLSV